MSRRARIAGALGTLCALGILGTWCRTGTYQTTPKSNRSIQAVGDQSPSSASQTSSTSVHDQSGAGQSPLSWRDLPPLSEQEKRDFAEVEAQVSRFKSWGKIDPSKVDEFRRGLWLLGDRGVADATKRLLAVRRDEVTNHDEAERVIEELDTIGYLADLKRPVALSALENLAGRKIERDDSGAAKDGLAATVTLEAYDLLAKAAPERAFAVVQRLETSQWEPFVLHYIYGRRLAGLSEDQIKAEVLSTFGPTFVRS